MRNDVECTCCAIGGRQICFLKFRIRPDAIWSCVGIASPEAHVSRVPHSSISWSSAHQTIEEHTNCHMGTIYGVTLARCTIQLQSVQIEATIFSPVLFFNR